MANLLKKKRALLITAFIAIVLIVVSPTLVKAAPANNPIFATIEKVEQMISDTISPLFKIQ